MIDPASPWGIGDRVMITFEIVGPPKIDKMRTARIVGIDNGAEFLIPEDAMIDSRAYEFVDAPDDDWGD